MSEALILGLLQLVPGIVEAAAQLKADGQIKDQTALDAALVAALKAMNDHIDQALIDLDAASKKS